jgi:hypothetical protein
MINAEREGGREGGRGRERERGREGERDREEEEEEEKEGGNFWEKNGKKQWWEGGVKGRREVG